MRLQLSDAAAFKAALYYHDAVYDPRCHDNEALSAALVREACAAPAEPGLRRALGRGDGGPPAAAAGLAGCLLWLRQRRRG